MPRLKTEKRCTGCSACVAACQQNAIKLRMVGLGATVPYIDNNLCIECGKCFKICYSKPSQNNKQKQAFVFINNNKDLIEKSASGGAFSSLATHIISMGGIVYGCEMFRGKNGLEVTHCRIDKINELPRILGSKYVNSNCIEAYKLAKEDILKGNIVLFSGRSCQINALYSFLDRKSYDNLITVDLICHGVPGEIFFKDYVSFLEKKHKGEILNFSFRTKENGKIEYVETFKLKKHNSQNTKLFHIPMHRSYYYKLFMLEESYRLACYNCPYATINKPADITLGDYFEVQNDYPDLYKEIASQASKGISAVIIHTKKGIDLFKKVSKCNYVVEVDPIKVQSSHKQLNLPGQCTKLRGKCIDVYNKSGYKSLHVYLKFKEVTEFPIIVIKSGIRKIMALFK